jgi:hypothetical protein
VQPNIRDRLVFRDRAIRTIIAAMPRIEFDPTNHSQLYAVTLHATIVQLCGGWSPIACSKVLPRRPCARPYEQIYALNPPRTA